MYCSVLIVEDGFGGSGPKEELHTINPTALLFVSEVLQHLKNL